MIDYQAELAAAKARIKARSDADMAQIPPRDLVKGLPPIHVHRRRLICEGCGKRMRFVKDKRVCLHCKAAI